MAPASALLLIMLLWIHKIEAQEALAETELRILKVGEEKMGELLPLRMQGSAVYQIEGLNPGNTYEIKISYPASVPAAFSLTLLHEKPRSTRRILNVEKIIFSAGSHLIPDEGSLKAFVLVSVRPAGVVAKRGFKEQEFIIYNILCERVYLGGIPEQALWIGFLATAAILASFLLARSFPKKKLAAS